MFVCGHTHVNVFVPVSLTKIKRVLVESVQRRVTTPEYSMLQAIFFLFLGRTWSYNEQLQL